MLMLVLTGALSLDSLTANLPPMTAAAYVGIGDRSDLAQHSVQAGWLTPEQMQSKTSP